MIKGRIVKAISGFYYVYTEELRVRSCRARGVFKKRGVKPVVGDHVDVEPIGLDEGTVVQVAPRRNLMTRPVVANVDQVLLVFALADPPLSLYQVDKLLAAVECESIACALVFTKLDLPGAVEDFGRVSAIYGPLGYEVCALALPEEQGGEALRALLGGRVTVLAGQSGVGKSTILRNLLPGASATPGALSERSGRGKQTTTHVELFAYAGGFVADTPGFSQIDLTQLELTDLRRLFREIDSISQECEFRGCLHETEDGCAVRPAAASGRMTASRYDHYLQLLSELKEAKARRY